MGKLIQPYRKEEDQVEWLRRLVDALNDNLYPEDWHEVGATGEPDFEGTWTNYTTNNWESAGFYKDPFGVVHIKGVVSSGAINSTIFYLPAGYIPSKKHMFTSIDGNHTHVRLDIREDGSVSTINATSNVYQSIWASFRV